MMATQRDPYVRAYDTEDDDFAQDCADGDLFGGAELRDEFGFGEFGCSIPDRCCMPGAHFPSECVSVEMMEDLCAEAAGELEPADRPVPDTQEGPF